MAHMLRFSVVALAALVLLGMVGALLPAPSVTERSGVSLLGVSLRLYPAQDQAEWRFAVPHLSFNPVSGESQVSQLRRGERWVTEDGRQRLDLTLAAARLTIGADDNLSSDAATLYILQDCMTVSLRGQEGTLVQIDQNSGYSAPLAAVDSPTIRGRFRDLSAAFDLSRFEGEQLPGSQFDASASQECVGGQLQERG